MDGGAGRFRFSLRLVNLWRTAAYFSAYTVSRLVPKPVGIGIADTASSLAHALKKKERATVRRNQSALLGLPEDSPEVRRAVRRVYRNFGRACTDLLYATRAQAMPLLPDLRIVGREHLDRALALGKGVLLAGAHTGRWEMGAMALASRGYRLTALAHAPAAGVAGLYGRQRERTGLQVIDAASRGLIKCVRVLRQGGILGIMADRRYHFGAFRTEFLGRPAFLPQGALRLSAACGSPIVGGTLRLDAKGVPVMRFWERIDAPDPDRPEALQETARRLTRLMEAMIREAPDEWFCFENPWTEPH